MVAACVWAWGLMMMVAVVAKAAVELAFGRGFKSYKKNTHERPAYHAPLSVAS